MDVPPKDPQHWLHRLSPGEWIRAALAEVRRAEEAYARRDGRAGLAGCKRAAGMALNGALCVEPNDAWGRSYVEHLKAVAEDEAVAAPVQEACRNLAFGDEGGRDLVVLHRASASRRAVESAKDVIAHAYAVVVRHGGFP